MTAVNGGAALASPPSKEGYAPLQPLRARLNLASQRDQAALEDAVAASQAYARPESEAK